MAAKEQEFYSALKDVFVGAKVEGESGYVNLMRMKSRYFREKVFPRLQEDIEAVLDVHPEFRNELFDKLYDFFHRYFSESGSIYFRRTRYPQSVYEQVYTDDHDVILFWKTRMLYYVKTDRLFNSMAVEFDEHKFFFDVSELEHKQANEKRDLVYRFGKVRENGTIVLMVEYSTHGSKTKILDMLRALRGEDVDVGEDVLQRAFRVFEKQSEVDYFINKDAEKFLKEQFDLWMYQYIFDGENVWLQRRIEQLQALKRLAFCVIDFIAQFEDELVRVWNKPKFVRNSHYVITLDRIAERDTTLLQRVLDHEGMSAQVAEWRELGMVGNDFQPADAWDRDLFGERLDDTYRYLPLDTCHVPDLEMAILGLFDHLDEALDGWLIKSENYQALTSLSRKFRERVKHIYIDPPYNSPSTEILYVNRYKHSSWLSLMSNRLDLAKIFLESDGVLTIAIDDIELSNLSLLVKEILPEYDLTTVTVIHNPRGNISNNFSQTHEYALFLTPGGKSVIARTARENKAPRPMRRWGQYSRREDRPSMFYPIYVKDNEITRIGTVPDEDFHPKAKNLRLENGEIEIWPIDVQGTERRWNFSLNTIHENLDRILVIEEEGEFDLFVSSELTVPKTVWTDSKFDAGVYGSNLLNQMLPTEFTFPKSVHTVYQSVEIVCKNRQDAIIFDFFAGSGTTAHAVMNLNREDGGQRKYILVEMADYFDSVLLPRVKKVAFSDDWKDGVAQEGGRGMSHFVKYYALEQYEDVLRNATYIEDVEPFDNPYEDPYQQYVFLRDLKMLDALEVDHEENEVRVDLSKLYPDIDIAETLANLRGKWIGRITPEFVEFEDGEQIDLQNLDWKMIKPLIWW